jgi:hypothetical protein
LKTRRRLMLDSTKPARRVYHPPPSTTTDPQMLTTEVPFTFFLASPSHTHTHTHRFAVQQQSRHGRVILLDEEGPLGVGKGRQGAASEFLSLKSYNAVLFKAVSTQCARTTTPCRVSTLFSISPARNPFPAPVPQHLNRRRQDARLVCTRRPVARGAHLNTNHSPTHFQ